MDAAAVAEALQVSVADGLSSAEVQRRLDRFGTNELQERGRKNPVRIFWEQLTAPMMLVLIVAAGVKAAFQDWRDVAAILAIVLLNAILGFVQEYRAEKAMAALKRMAAPAVRVRRNGAVAEIPSGAIVPGDVVLLEAGNAVPADGRLVEAINLRIQEASLTGESVPVDKDATVVSGPDAPLGDRHNAVFMGTSVAYGRGSAIVTDTGMRTQLGRIADLLQGVSQGQTPLQKRVAVLGKMLGLGVLVVVGLMFTIGVLRGENPQQMFLDGVVIAVAAIPEGLPAVMTITLAIGASRMLSRKALIRRLPAVETLGSVTTICSDKTGTLTENRMTVRIADIAGHSSSLDEDTQDGHPFLDASAGYRSPDHPDQALLLAGGTLCNDAVLQPDDAHPKGFVAIGDPTEGALLVAAARFGLSRDRLERAWSRVAEVPFTSERKRMSTFHQRVDTAERGPGVDAMARAYNALGTPYVMVTKGGTDAMLSVCSGVWTDGAVEPLTPEWESRLEASNDRMASEGLRVLAIAIRGLDEPPAAGDLTHMEQSLILVGLVGMMDPPRAEVKDAVLRCRTAGIRPVMITGDHPLTALQIARELHIAENDSVLTGADLSEMSPEALRDAVERVAVYARVAPEHKLRIVEALQDRGHVVAMTGDGVNDAPALRKSDMGVAMGITGTDVAKEAADMVVLDDNFASIVAAIEQGRAIYDNVRKFVKYIVTSNTGEVTVMLLSQVAGMPLPLNTLQILWMNLVTDGVPGLALGLEPIEADAMRRPPFSPGESIFSRGIGRHIVIIGLLLAAVAFGVGYWGYATGQGDSWKTMVFVTLTLSQLGHAMAVRSNRRSLFETGLGGNPALLWAVLVTLALQMAVIYVEPLSRFFSTTPLNATQLAVSLIASTVVFWAVEVEKWLYRRAEAPQPRVVA